MTLAQHLEALLPPDSRRRFGELALTRCQNGVFEARHHDDENSADELREITSTSELREIAKFDEEGNYRPLKTAPTLARGWMSRAERVDEFLSHLDAIYPGVFATWIAYDAGIHAPTPLRQTLDRQTGIYRFAGAITDQMANRIMRETCARGCIRQIAWPIDDTCAVSKLKGSRRFIPSICTEACTFAVSETRRLAKEAYDKANAPAGAEELRS